MLTGLAPFWMSWLVKDQTYDVDVWVSEIPYHKFFGKTKTQHKKKQRDPPVTRTEPVWSLRNLTYSLDHEWSNSQNTTIDLDMDTINRIVVKQNRTMYVHARVYMDNPLHAHPEIHPRFQQLLQLMPSLKQYLPPVLYFESFVPLVDFNQKSQIEQKNNLFGDYDLPAEKKEASKDASEEKYVPYIK